MKDIFSKVLENIILKLNECLSARDIVKLALEEIGKGLQWSWGHAYLWNPARNVLSPSGIWYVGSHDETYQSLRRVTDECEFAPGISLPGRVYSSRKPVYITDISQESDFQRIQKVPELKFQSAIAFPLFVKNDPAIVLEFFSLNRIEQSKDVEDFLHLIGRHLSYVIERHNIEKTLREANRLTQAVLANTKYMVVAADIFWTTLLFNKEAERELGYSAQEVVNKLIPTVWHDNSEIEKRAEELSKEFNEPISASYEVLVRKALFTGSEEREWTLIRKDGTSFKADMLVTTLRDEEDIVIGFLSFMRLKKTH